MVSTAKLRRILLSATAAAGLALLGTSFHGLVTLDADLSDAAQRSAPAPGVPVSEGRDADCPYEKRVRPERRVPSEAT